MKSPVCECSECRAARFGMGGLPGHFYSTPEQRIERARQQYLDEPVRWGPQLYTAEWFEREVDEILRVTHERFVAERMRWHAAIQATLSPPRSTP